MVYWLIWGDTPSDLVEKIHADKKQILTALRECNLDHDQMKMEQTNLDARMQEQEAQHTRLTGQLRDIHDREKKECERFVQTTDDS